jgi:hypothetical protein
VTERRRTLVKLNGEQHRPDAPIERRSPAIPMTTPVWHPAVRAAVSIGREDRRVRPLRHDAHEHLGWPIHRATRPKEVRNLNLNLNARNHAPQLWNSTAEGGPFAGSFDNGPCFGLTFVPASR